MSRVTILIVPIPENWIEDTDEKHVRFLVVDRSKLPVVYFVQPGSGTGGEVWVATTAARGEVGAGAVGSPHGDPHGWVHAGPTALGHDRQARVGVDEAGDEGLVPGQRLQRARGLREAIGAAGADVVELVLGREDAVLQGEGTVAVGPLATPYAWGGLAQAAVDAVGVTQL